MNLRFWYKSLVQLCIGIAIGCIGVSIWKQNWAILPGWVSALFWAVGWRLEMSARDDSNKEAAYWKNMWLNSRSIDMNGGFGKPRYVTQEELDERKKRIMEYDFSTTNDKEAK